MICVYLKVKPAWLAEIGTRTAEIFDGETWSSIPSMSRAKVSVCVWFFPDYISFQSYEIYRGAQHKLVSHSNSSREPLKS
jgi:hypothetical protein